MGYAEKDGSRKAVEGEYKNCLVMYLTTEEWNTSFLSLTFVVFSFIMVHPSGLKAALPYVFQAILMKPAKGLNQKSQGRDSSTPLSGWEQRCPE